MLFLSLRDDLHGVVMVSQRFPSPLLVYKPISCLNGTRDELPSLQPFLTLNKS